MLGAVWGDVESSTITAKLPSLYPEVPLPTEPSWKQHVAEDFSTPEILAALKTFPRGSSGGLAGVMADHLAGDGPEYLRCLQAVTTFVSAFAWNQLPPDVAALVSGAKLVCLPKKDGGLRPIAIGELFRRIAGKVLVNRYQAKAAASLLPIQ